MGYLTSGALAGVGKEYLKQSGEARQAKYQEIRDRRLAELTTKENIRQEGVRAAEAATEREFRSGEARTKREHEVSQAELDREQRIKEARMGWKGDLGRGEIGYRMDEEGNVIEYGRGPEYTHAPTAASLSYDKWRQQSVGIRGEGGQEVGRESRENLYKEWEGQAYSTTTDELGNKVITRNEGIPGWDDWLNARVTDEYKTAPSDPTTQRQNPMELYLYFQSQPQFKHPNGRQMAIEAIQSIHPWWKPPELEEGATKPVPAGDQQAAEGPPGMQPQPAWQPTSPTAPVEQRQAGMLEQSQGRLNESSWELQRELEALQNELRNMGRGRGQGGDNPARREQLNQQIQQYKLLLERAIEEEARTQGRGRFPANPRVEPTQVAQR